MKSEKDESGSAKRNEEVAGETKATEGSVAPPAEKAGEKLCIELARVIVEFESILKTQKCVNEAPYFMRVWTDGAEALKLARPDLNPVYAAGGTMFDQDHTALQTVEECIAEYRRLAGVISLRTG